MGTGVSPAVEVQGDQLAAKEPEGLPSQLALALASIGKMVRDFLKAMETSANQQFQKELVPSGLPLQFHEDGATAHKVSGSGISDTDKRPGQPVGHAGGQPA